MDEPRLMQRLVRAAEDWGLRSFGKQMKALSSTALEQHADGSVAVTIDLYAAQDDAETGSEPDTVTCITTLEPDGRISCVTANQI